MDTGYYDEAGLYVTTLEEVQEEIWLDHVLERLHNGEKLSPDLREKLIIMGFDPNSGDYMDNNDMDPIDLRELDE